MPLVDPLWTGFWEFGFGIKPEHTSLKGSHGEQLRNFTGAMAGIYLGDTPYVGPLLGIVADGPGTFLELGMLTTKRINDIKEAESLLGSPPPPTRVDPLILDLNRDGSIALQNAAFFDLNANGFHEYTSWISETDAFLVLDKNFNGTIDNGSELFGDAMILPDGSRALTGFDALRAYDSNSDGKINSDDEIYASLKVLIGAGEIVSLADAGIKSITLPPTSSSIGETFIGGSDSSDSSGSSGSSGSSSSGESFDPWASFTWEERVQATKDQARAREETLRANGGTISSTGSFEWEDGTTGVIGEALPYRIPMLSVPDEYYNEPLN